MVKRKCPDENNLGIPTDEFLYIKPQVSRIVENKICQRVVESAAEYFDELCLHSGVKPKIEFINYGDTELVYVLDYAGKQYTLLLGQPAVEFGKIKKEADLLKKYAKLSPKTVVAPIKYVDVISPYSEKETCEDLKIFKRECFITPYFNQARCIASQESGFGIYVPEPVYHFESFTEKEAELVCACMIAKLVMLYDGKTQSGISACKLGGGDFMLEKSWDRFNTNIFDTLDKMKLIAARNEIKIPFSAYLKKLEEEFSQRTFYINESERDHSILINHKARVPMAKSTIQKGIAIGLEIRKRRDFIDKQSKNSKNTNKSLIK